MRSIEHTMQQHHHCRPTDASVLSACARSMSNSASGAADAADYLCNLADAALAVSVFAFLGMMTVCSALLYSHYFGIVALLVAALLLLCSLHYFYDTVRFYIYRLFGNIKAGRHPYQRSAYSLG